MPYLIASIFSALMLFGFIALAGSGHGWVTGAWGSLALAPITFVAWVNALRPRPALAWAHRSLAAGLLILVGVAAGTMSEGVNYFFGLWRSWGLVATVLVACIYLSWGIAWWIAISRSRPPSTR